MLIRVFINCSELEVYVLLRMQFTTVTMLFSPSILHQIQKRSVATDTNQNQTFCPNLIFDITSNDIVEKNKKNTEVARRELHLL